MSDLDNSFNDFFYEERIIRFIREIINSYIAPSPINQTEVTLLNEKERILEIDKLYEGNFVQSLTEYSKFISPKDAIFFLFEAMEIEKTETAKEIMDWTVKETSTMTLNQLFESLKQEELMPVFWMPKFYGDYNEEGREIYSKKPIEKQSSINMEKLKNFK